jgi:hypothetical protein
MSFKLSGLTDSANVNPELVTFDTNIKKILHFIHTVQSLLPEREGIKLSMISNYVDLFLTVPMTEIIPFSYKSFHDESYYDYFNSIVKFLLTNNTMNYIFTGNRRDRP